MGQSGTKLALAMVMLALGLGVLSWWYRYESAHQSTVFWGPEAAEWISRPSQVKAFQLDPTAADVESGAESDTSRMKFGNQWYQLTELQDLTNARGMVHLRHSLMTDRNYDWQSVSVDNARQWQWCLGFYGERGNVLVLLDREFITVGKVRKGGEEVSTVSCQAMSETLQEYFRSIGVFSASTRP